MKNSALGLILILLAMSSGCSGGARDGYAPLAAPSLQSSPAALRPSATRAKYVYISGNNTLTGSGGGDPELAVYSASANGNVAPVHVVRGPETGLERPEQVALDASGRFWVCDNNANALFAYPAGAWNNEAPLIAIKGSNTQLNGCGGIAIASNGAIYATSYGTNSGGPPPAVLKFAAGSQANAAPAATYAGSLTSLKYPASLALYANGDVLVADTGARSTLLFGAVGGNVSPQRTIAGSNTRTNQSYGVALDPATQHIVVANSANNTVQIFAAAANGNAAPIAWIAGNKTKIASPFAVAVDNAGYLYVGTCPENQPNPQASILVYAPGAHGNAAPVQTIGGAKTDLACVTGLYVR